MAWRSMVVLQGCVGLDVGVRVGDDFHCDLDGGEVGLVPGEPCLVGQVIDSDAEGRDEMGVDCLEPLFVSHGSILMYVDYVVKEREGLVERDYELSDEGEQRSGQDVVECEGRDGEEVHVVPPVAQAMAASCSAWWSALS